MRVILTVFDAIERYMLIFCLVSIVLLIFFGVLSRFIFHYSIAWSEELVRYMFVWGGLFGAAAAFRSGKHSGIPIIIERLPLPLQRLSAWSVMIATTGYCGFMAVQAYRSVLRAFATGQVSPTTGIPVWVVNLIMALAFTWCTIRAAQFFFSPPGKSEMKEELEAAESGAQTQTAAGKEV